MDIKVFAGGDGLVIFACQGIFHKPVEKVIYQADSSMVLLDFGNGIERETLDCPLDKNIATLLLKQGFAALGYLNGKELGATQIVPLEKEGKS